MRSFAPALCILAVCTFPAYATQYVVNDLGDAPDAVPGNNVCATAGAVCTLRAAIGESVAHAGSDSIAFSVAGTIAPATSLPSIQGVVAIDGTTAPGYAGTPVVVLQGTAAISALSFVSADGSSVRGLKIHGFSTAIQAGDAIAIQRNHLGPIGGGSPNQVGLQLEGSGNVIGGNTNGDGNVISGNTIAGIRIADDLGGNVIADNFIGTDAAGAAALPNRDGILVLDTPSVVIGGPAGAENVISGNQNNGISLQGGAGLTIAGNFIGTDATGTFAVPNSTGILIDNPLSIVIGSTAGGMNVISGNTRNGIAVLAMITGAKTPERRVATTGVAPEPVTRIVGNRIGTDGTGMNDLGNGRNGVEWRGSDFKDVRAIFEDNLISGNDGNGVLFQAAFAPKAFHRNIIGRNAANTAPLPNGRAGIAFDGYEPWEAGGGDAPDVTIGSAAEGGNVIASNGGAGVRIAATSTQIFQRVLLSANSIFGNQGLGIDLTLLPGGDGVTANDPQDPDQGPNGLQNFPVIASAVTTGSASSIEGSLHSTPSTSFSLYFYANTAADPSGYGEGETVLGTTTVTTDASGNASFVWSGPPLSAGLGVTATATNGARGTSEFSAAVAVAQANATAAIPTASTWGLMAMLAALAVVALVKTQTP